MFKAYIDNLTFCDGTAVRLDSNSVLVIIGPNNSGKSATLRDIYAGLEGKNTSFTLSNVSVKKVTSVKEVQTEMSKFQEASGQYNLANYNFRHEHIAGWWADATLGSFFSKILVSNLTTRERLGDCDPPPNFQARNLFDPRHPFQHMYRNTDAEEKASSVVRRAFKHDLLIHRLAGNTIPAYVGNRPSLVPGEDRISPSYVEKIEALSRVEDQGDGIRSFISILCRVICEARPIQMIDEPEAFLHPPQARMIGEEVVLQSTERQTFITTHSSDVLRGLLSSGDKRISIIRLARGKSITTTYLNNEDVVSLWKDPILRFSNVLDGLFHDAVIITEGDANCRFYETVANAIVPSDGLPDLLYTYGGGKDRIPVLVRSLVALDVPVASIVDFDVLNNDQPLRKLVEAHRGDWVQIEGIWKSVKAGVESSRSFVDGEKFRREVTELIKSYGSSPVVPKEVLTSLKKLARNASPWDQIKGIGLPGISPGEATAAAKNLLEMLAVLGIFVIPVGEMEGFCRSIGNHGPRWVEEALRQDIKNGSEFITARDFVKKVVGFLEERRMMANKRSS